MENKDNVVKKIVKKKIISTVAGPVVATLLIVAIISGIVSSILHFITFTDGTVQENDLSNAPYVVDTYMGETTISDDGKINTDETVKEIWDKIVENKGRVNEYLKKPEELKKIINTEMITKFLDTRPESEINNPIDWDKMNNDVNSTEVQGIIKLKRAREDGRIITLTYVSEKEFQGYIDEYNATGSSSAKENALSHFTLKKGYKALNGDNGSNGTSGIGNFPDYSAKEGDGTVLTANGGVTIGPGGFKETWYDLDMTQVALNMKNIYGIGNGLEDVWIDVETGCKMYGNYIMVAGDVKHSSNPNGTLERGQIVETSLGLGIVVDSESQAIADRENGITPPRIDIATIWDKEQQANKGWPTSNPALGGTSKVVTTSEKLASTEKVITGETSKIAAYVSQGGPGSGATDGSSDLWWPLDQEYKITSQFGERIHPITNERTFHYGIDIGGMAGGSPIYAAEKGRVIFSGWKNDIGGYVVEIDHGNGIVTRYLHCSKLYAKTGDIVGKGQQIAGAGSTGRSTGVHLHFEIIKDGVPVNPLQYTYNNGMGGGTAGFGSNVVGTPVIRDHPWIIRRLWTKWRNK